MNKENATELAAHSLSGLAGMINLITHLPLSVKFVTRLGEIESLIHILVKEMKDDG